jgi:hypothetical protein
MSSVRAALLALLLATPALAQGRDGLWDVTGTDAALGAFRGRLELRSTGPGAYDVVREVTYTATVSGGKRLTTVWTGRATESGLDLTITASLRKTNWITRHGGSFRTLTDKAPVAVRATFRPDPSGGLSGAFSGPGVATNEVARRTGNTGAVPIFAVERRLEPIHGAPPALVKNVLFIIFGGYHAKPEIAPYVRDLRFQAAIHQNLIDRTGFDWLRARPTELLVVDQVVDGISLEEAEVRRSTFGLRAFEKAALHAADAEGRLRDTTGLISYGARPTAAGGWEPIEDMSACLWTGVYGYAEALRWQVTGEAKALQNVEKVAELLCDLVEIDPRPGEFARSLRPIGRAPLGGSWHAGTGRFAHLAWHDNGNNDMVKGLVLGFLGAWDVLPPSHPLRPRIQASIREIADHWIGSAVTGTGTRRDSSGNKITLGMLAHWVTGDPAYERIWKGALRKPLALLELASGGTFSAWGIADWSGTHLGVCSRLAMAELSRRLRTPWQVLFDQSIEASFRFVGKYARCTLPWSAARAGLLNRRDRGAAERVVWGLREFPFPKPRHEVDRSLDPDWVASPYPSLPWKLDWMTNAGRRQGLISYPTYMGRPSNYVWRSTPLDAGDAASDVLHPAPDYLFVYWLARKHGLLSATD